MPAIDIDTTPKGAGIAFIQLRVLAACALFASKDERRYYLNGVCVEIDEKGTTYVVTDGHRLLCYRDDLVGQENFHPYDDPAIKDDLVLELCAALLASPAFAPKPGTPVVDTTRVVSLGASYRGRVQAVG